MKLSIFPWSQTSASKLPKTHNRTAAAGVHNSKSKDGHEGFIAASAYPAGAAEVHVGKAKYPAPTSTTPKATQESPDRHAQRNLPRAEVTPTITLSPRTAVFGAPPPPATSTSSLVCDEDNCLRGLLRYPDEAHTFCPLFLGPKLPDGRNLATMYSGPCEPSQQSSACSCFESKLHTGCCTLTETTWDPTLRSLMQSWLKSTDESDAFRAQSTSSSRNPATKPIEHWGPPVTETVTSTRGLNPTAVVADVSLWPGGGEVPGPEVVAVIVSCSHNLFSHPSPVLSGPKICIVQCPAYCFGMLEWLDEEHS